MFFIKYVIIYIVASVIVYVVGTTFFKKYKLTKPPSELTKS